MVNIVFRKFELLRCAFSIRTEKLDCCNINKLRIYGFTFAMQKALSGNSRVYHD